MNIRYVPLMITVSLVALLAPHVTSQSVVASTAWTGAFALAAGAEDVHVLAPFDLSHPPEYELRPSDIRTVIEADVVIYAGYETMVDRLVDAVDDRTTQTVQIETVHSVAAMRRSIDAIARVLGTEARAQDNLGEITAFLAAWSAELMEGGLNATPVLVHVHQRALALELGMNVVGVFGPAPLEARQIVELTRLGARRIIDNGHNPVAQPLRETTGADVAVWYNFPGIQNSRTVLDVFEINRAAITAGDR